MSFEKGESGNPSGRPQGAKNKATVEIKTLLEQEVDWAFVVRKLLELVGGVTVQEKIGRQDVIYTKPPDAYAARILLEYGFGKPKQSIDLGDKSFVLTVNTQSDKTKQIVEGE